VECKGGGRIMGGARRGGVGGGRGENGRNGGECGSKIRVSWSKRNRRGRRGLGEKRFWK